jgi:hypothetical protein
MMEGIERMKSDLLGKKIFSGAMTGLGVSPQGDKATSAGATTSPDNLAGEQACERLQKDRHLC